MATFVDKQMKDLLDILTKVAAELPKTARGASELDDAIGKLQGINASTNKLKDLAIALGEVSKAQQALSKSTNIQLPDFGAIKSQIRDLTASYSELNALMDRVRAKSASGNQVPIDYSTARQVGEQSIQTTLTGSQLEARIRAQQALFGTNDEALGATRASDVSGTANKAALRDIAQINSEWARQARAASKIQQSIEKEQQNLLQAYINERTAEIENVKLAQQRATQDVLNKYARQQATLPALETVAKTDIGIQANQETKALFQQELDAEKRVVDGTEAVAKLQQDAAKTLEQEVQARRQVAYNTALAEAKSVNKDVSIAQNAAIAEDKARTATIVKENLLANQQTVALFKAELQADEQVVKSTQTIADLQSQTAKEQEKILQAKRQQAFDNAKTDAALLNQQINTAHGEAIAEDRARNVAKVEAEARAAREKLQTAGTQSAFSSVLGGTNTAELEKFNSLLTKYKLSAKDITGISKDLSTGVSQISFAMQDANGVMQQGSIHVDRFGRILQDTSGRFKNFGDMISRNVVKVLEWAVSLSLVYGSIQKITELIATMQKLQTVMVDIGIVTGQSSKSLNGLFDSVRQIADITSSDFATGIESLNVALRATSGTAEPTQRTAQAITLLKDAMTLAKLAGIDNAAAMDYLVASLKQMDLALTEGSTLLDKFQAVSQQSNTTIEDLAATFSITAGAAQDVGVGVNELTGLIGAFSEATTLSATETGNALRAMFSNFTQPQGVEVLNKYGIAVRDVTGQFRSFTDVFKQASELARSGVLNDRQVAEIANALGGGSRRQAQVTALLTVQPRAEQLANIAATDSAGKAQEALAQKTETLGSALERLQNAFDGLANSLGNSGGFLDILTDGVKALTGILNIINDVTKALGPSTSALIGFGVAFAALKQYGPNIAEALGGIGIKSPTTTRTIYTSQGEQQITSSPQWFTVGKNMATAFAPVILSTYAQLKEGNTSQAIGGAIGGGLIAILTGNPLWAIIGQIIGQTAANAITNAVQQKENYNKALNQVPSITGNESQEQLANLRSQAIQGIQGLSGFAVGQSQVGQRILVQAGQTVSGIFGSQLTTSEQLLKAVENYKKAKDTGKEFASYDLAQTFGFSIKEIEQASKYLSVLEQIDKAASKKPEQGTLTSSGYQGMKSFQDELSKYSQEKNRAQMFDITTRFGKGEVSKGDYQNAIEPLTGSIESAGDRASRALIALNPVLQSATKEGIQPFIGKWKELRDQLSEAPTELLSYFDTLTSDITQLNEKVGAAKTALELLKAVGAGSDQIDQATAALAEQNSQRDLAVTKQQALLNLIKESTKEQFKFSGFGDYTKYTDKQIEGFRQQALKLQEGYGNQMGIDPSKLTDFANTNPFTIFTKSGTFEQPKGVIQQFFDFVIGENERAAKAMSDTWQFQNLRNVDAAQKGRLQQAINYYTQLLKKYGMNEKNELITVLFKDNQVGQLIGSQTALQLALQDLTEVTKKQLDGVYNLPSGATAFIPLSAGQMLSNYTANQASGSNIDYGNFPTPVIEKGNSILQQIDNGIQQLIDLAGRPFDPTKQLETAKKGLESGDYKNIYEALKANSIFNTQMGPPSPNNKQQTPSPQIDSQPSIITSLVSQLTRFTSQLMTGQSIINRIPGLGSGLGINGAGSNIPQTTQVNITPAKIEASYNTTTTIRLDGRILWSAIKKYAFEDYARFTTSVGNNGRSQTNVI